MANPAVLGPLFAVLGVIGAALISGIFSRANNRSAERDRARAELLEGKNERIDDLEKSRDEARADLAACRADRERERAEHAALVAVLTGERDDARRQVAGMQRVIEQSEQRPTREVPRDPSPG